MNAVDLVKQICKERGISVAKLERDCDFSNGYIGKIKKGVSPSRYYRINPINTAKARVYGIFLCLKLHNFL